MSSIAAFDLRRPAPLAPLSAPASERASKQLPVPLTSFVGRERDVAAIQQIILSPNARLLTLTGPGGVGKTRLALRVLSGLHDAFPGGVWFVELASIRDPDLVLPAVAATLGFQNAGDSRVVDSLAVAIGGVRTLIALDNLEQVVDAASDIGALLGRCPSLVILATSRIALRLGGEQLFPVAPLPVPEPPRTFEADHPEDDGAVELFMHRAQSVRPGFTVDATNAAIVTEICRRLDGLPLAIELAATRTKVLSPAALLLRLDHKLQILTGGPRDLPDRQRTLRDTIAWSYDLLLPAQQALFRLLAVFARGFTLDAAEAIAGVDGDILDDLSDLVDGGLVRQDEQPGGETRFRILETVREFAQERLEDSGEILAVCQRHADWFLRLISQANLTEYRDGETESLARLGQDLDNIRAALGWSLRPEATDSDIDVALRIAAGMERFFITRSLVPEGRSWVERALLRGAGASDEARARGLAAAGILAMVEVDDEASLRYSAESVALWDRLDNPAGEISALFFMGLVAWRNRDVSHLAEIVTRAAELHPKIEWSTWKNTIHVLNGMMAHARGDVDRAQMSLERAVHIYEQIGFTWGVGWLTSVLGAIALQTADLQQALRRGQQALGIFWEHGDIASVGNELVGIALVATRLGQADQSARLLGLAASVRDASGLVVTREAPLDAMAIAETTAALGADAFAAGFAAGRTLAPGTGVAEALAIHESHAPIGQSPILSEPATRSNGNVFRLTPRELEVLRQLTTGRTTNRDLAEALSISPKTAGNHVDNILAKLEVKSRVAAISLALNEGLG